MRYGNVYTAMITPFDENLEVDYEQAYQLAEHLIRTGSEGIVIAGTTGESPTLTSEEKRRLVEVVKQAAGDRADIIIGAGTNTTAGTIEAVKEAERFVADGIMLVVPYYNKPSQEGLYEHFKRSVSYTDKPVILYNIPGRTGSNLLPETVGRLAEVKQIVGIKEASGSLDQITEIRMNTSEDFMIYSGDDAMTLPILALGGNGVISVASHIVGDEIAEMIRSWQSGNTERAMQLHLKLYPLFKTLFIAPNPAPVKYALGKYGFDVNRLRLPMHVINRGERMMIESVMERLGLPEHK